MPQKQLIALGIALRTGVLKICPEHGQIFCDDDVDPGLAFALAQELMRRHNAYVAPFADSRQLADGICEAVGMAPRQCPRCADCAAPFTSTHRPPTHRLPTHRLIANRRHDHREIS